MTSINKERLFTHTFKYPTGSSDISQFLSTSEGQQLRRGLLGGSSTSVGNFVLLSPQSKSNQVPPITRDNAALLQLLIARLQTVVHEPASDGPEREKKRTSTDKSAQVARPSPELLASLCTFVVQVCRVDPDAAARLIDVTIKVLPVEETSVVPLVSQLAQQQSIPISQLLPLILPAIAVSLGDPQGEYSLPASMDLTASMDCILSQGKEVIKEIIALNNLLRELLNQVAGIMCLAAKQLNQPLCSARHQHGGLIFELIIPCQVKSPSYPMGGYDKATGIEYSSKDGSKATPAPLSVSTLPGDYAFSSMPAYNSVISQSYESTTALLYTEALPTLTGYDDGSRFTTSWAANPNRNKGSCPCQSSSWKYLDVTSTVVPPSMPSRAPCPCQGTGYACDDCPGGWFCPPRETAAQDVSCGMGWLCYHCKSGTFCAHNPPPVMNSPASTSAALPPSNTDKSSTATFRTSTAEAPIYHRSTMASASSSSGPSNPGTSPTSPSSQNPSGNRRPDGWTYLGCFKDHGGQMLHGAADEDHKQGTMSSSICLNYCKSKGHGFAATENGSQCWCGKSLDANLTQLADVACGTVCNGTLTECCGGNDAASIYRRDPSDGDVNPQKQYDSLVALLAAV